MIVTLLPVIVISVRLPDPDVWFDPNLTLSSSMTDDDVMLIVVLLLIYCKATVNDAHMHPSSVQQCGLLLPLVILIVITYFTVD